MNPNRIHVDPGDPQALALRSASRTFNGPLQYYAPTPIILGAAPGAEGQLNAHIRIPIPDSRCRVKVSVIFFPSQGGTVPDDLALTATIWLAAYDEDHGGISGSAGKTAPVTDIEGHKNTPTQFPEAAGLSGYSRSFVTAADWVEADIAIVGVADASGFWTLQTRIQPNAVTLGWEEWDEIRRLFAPQRTA